ncbi:hypothetical protein psyc5s11_12120 [Clostridium gelidum]|uniref:Uncharacterized protein n=1 Tax=Clostridium gelidum TaxID=704125 RepID=A0ABN6ISG0_9CLOT|nr:hypothetical protein [Clostridium gelidum]BCZ45145.1 hypothetical protein psyc5s11_12120 [Clostridium gelidum]
MINTKYDKEISCTNIVKVYLFSLSTECLLKGINLGSLTNYRRIDIRGKNKILLIIVIFYII